MEKLEIIVLKKYNITFKLQYTHISELGFKSRKHAIFYNSTFLWNSNIKTQQYSDVPTLVYIQII